MLAGVKYEKIDDQGLHITVKGVLRLKLCHACGCQASPSTRPIEAFPLTGLLKCNHSARC